MNFRKLKKWMLAVFAFALVTAVLAGCGSSNTGRDKTAPTDEAAAALVIYSSHPIALINPLVEEFETIYGMRVEVISSGTGNLLERVEAEKSDPQGDIIWGGSLNVMKGRSELLENYQSENEAHVQDEFKNAEGPLTRFTDVPSIILVNTHLIGDIEVNGYEDLLNPALKGKIAYADPAKSSSSYEHLVNMLYAMGNGNPEDGWGYVEGLCQNLGGKLLGGSVAVYKGVSEGEYAIGLTLEDVGAKYMASGAPVKLVYMKEGVISRPDGIYIIKNAKHMDAAKQFLDFMISKETQKLITQKLYRRSVRDDVEPPEGLPDKASINLIHYDEDVMQQNEDAWLAKFKEIFAANKVVVK